MDTDAIIGLSLITIIVWVFGVMFFYDLDDRKKFQLLQDIRNSEASEFAKVTVIYSIIGLWPIFCLFAILSIPFSAVKIFKGLRSQRQSEELERQIKKAKQFIERE